MLYGIGRTYFSELWDYKHPAMGFDRDERLISDPSRTNADYGWSEVDEKTVKAESTSDEIRLVLSRIMDIGVETFNYGNTVKNNRIYSVGRGSNANRTLTASAMEVAVLPPFGEETEIIESDVKFNDNKEFIIGAVIESIVVVFNLIVIIRRFGKK